MKNDLLVLKNVEINRKLINTIKWIDDLIDKFFRDNGIKETFSIAVYSKEKNINRNLNYKIGVSFFIDNFDNLLNVIKKMSIIKEYKEYKDFLYFIFNFYSTIEYSKIINLNTKKGIAKMQIARVKINSIYKMWTLFWVGNLENEVNLRIHYQCETSEIFDSLHCDCKLQLNNFKNFMFKNKDLNSLLIYAHEEGRGFGIFNKINAYYNTEFFKLDTVEAMEKETKKSENRLFDVPADIIFQKKIKSVNIWTNNLLKIDTLLDRDIKVNRISAWYKVKSLEAIKYINDKKEKMGHI